MRTRPGMLLALMVLLISCLPFTAAIAQTQQAQWGPPPWPEQREREYERERERERRKEERREERREKNEQEWRRHHQRYYGGMVMERGPYESDEEYTRRVRTQCNQHWHRCASYCNTIRDAHQRAACVGNCNNELYECQSGF